MSDSDSLRAWEEWEFSYDEQQALRIDLVRIRGYALAQCAVAAKSKSRVEKAESGLVRARKKLEREIAGCQRACRDAELASSFAARAMAGDVEPAARREIATQLEELFG